MRRDLARLISDARARGRTVERTRKGHHRLRHASGATVIAGSTPSDWREIRNTMARLCRVERRMGETP